MHQRSIHNCGDKSMNDVVVGGTPGMPAEALNELKDLIARLNEQFYFKNGATAAYWHLAIALSEHIGEGRE